MLALKVIDPTSKLNLTHDFLESDSKLDSLKESEVTCDSHSSNSSAGSEPFGSFTFEDDAASRNYADLPTPNLTVRSVVDPTDNPFAYMITITVINA